MTPLQKEILNHRAIVQLEIATNGYWDGGPKSHFEFKPELERTEGKPAIRWGCYSANVWFVVETGDSLKSHFARLKRKLSGKPARRITIELIQTLQEKI